MAKKKHPLIWWLCTSLVLIIVAVVLSLTVGVRLGTDIGGGTQFEVTIENTSKVSEQTKQIKEVLRKNHLSAEKIFVEDEGIETKIVVRLAQKGIEETLPAQVAEKLGLEEGKVSALRTINGTITNKIVIWASVTIICVLIGVFVLGWIRYKIMAGLTLMFAALHTMLLSAALLIICRIPVNMFSVIIALSSCLVTLFACVLTLERLRENMKIKHNEGLSAAELVSMSKKSSLKPLVFMAAMILIFAVVLACTPVAYVALCAAAIVVCLLSSAFSYYFVSMDVHAYLLDAKMTRDKLRLSRNPDAGKAEKQPKEAQAKTEKAKPEKAKTKAETERNKEFKAKARAKKKPTDGGNAQPIV